MDKCFTFDRRAALPQMGKRRRDRAARRPSGGPDIAVASRHVPFTMLKYRTADRHAVRPAEALRAFCAGAAVCAVAVLAQVPAAYAFDGSSTDNPVPFSGDARLTPPANVPLAGAVRPVDEAFRMGTRAVLSGQTAKGLDALGYAAAQGHPMAQWKLAQMYAEGDGVKRDDAKAFEYYSKIANSHAEDYPGTTQSRFVASAFVALGSYYLVGIPAAGVKRDPSRARDMFSYAASYFGDANAQFLLGKMYLDGTGMHRDARNAGRWLTLASQKGEYHAQALLGELLFKGDDGVPRQGARGLMWLTLARDSATRPDDKWVVELHEEAFAQATPDERAQALAYLEKWLTREKR